MSQRMEIKIIFGMWKLQIFKRCSKDKEKDGMSLLMRLRTSEKNGDFHGLFKPSNRELLLLADPKQNVYKLDQYLGELTKTLHG